MQVNTKQIAKNSMWLYIRMLVVTLVSLYTSRIVLKALGVDDFGIFNLAGGVIAFIHIFTTGLASSTQRYLNLYKGEDDFIHLSKIMNISVRLHFFLGLLLLFIGETIGLFVVARVLNFPESRHLAAILVYQASLFTLSFAVFKIPFYSLVITYERFSFVALMSLLEVTLKLLVAFALLHINADSLILYGFSFTVLELTLFFIYRFYCRKLYEKQHVSRTVLLKNQDSKNLINFSLWSMLGSFGSTCANQGITIMLNFFYPLTVNAAMGITNQVTNVLASFVNNVQQAFRPQVLQSYANHDGSFSRLICTAAKWSFILMIFISVPLAININSILDLWLDVVPSYSANFILILLVFLLIDTIGTPLSYGIDATGKISKYQTTLFLIMLFNVLLAWIACILGMTPPYVIATKLVANSLIITLKIITLSKNSSEFSFTLFYSHCLKKIIPILFFAIISFFFFNTLHSWLRVLGSTVFYSTLLVVIVYCSCMTKEEQKIIKRLAYRLLRKA